MPTTQSCLSCCPVQVTTEAGSWGPSTLPSSVTLPPQAVDTPLGWSWPLFDEALSLTSSQAAELMQHLQTTPTATAAAAQQPGSSCIDDRQNAVQAPAVPAAPTGEGSAAVAAGPDIAECQGLQRLSVAAAAAAASESAALSPDGVQLVPHMCLLLYDNMLQSFGYTESPDMRLALEYMAARVSEDMGRWGAFRGGQRGATAQLGKTTPLEAERGGGGGGGKSPRRENCPGRRGGGGGGGGVKERVGTRAS